MSVLVDRLEIMSTVKRVIDIIFIFFLLTEFKTWTAFLFLWEKIVHTFLDSLGFTKVIQKISIAICLWQEGISLEIAHIEIINNDSWSKAWSNAFRLKIGNKCYI